MILITIVLTVTILCLGVRAINKHICKEGE